MNLISVNCHWSGAVVNEYVRSPRKTTLVWIDFSLSAESNEIAADNRPCHVVVCKGDPDFAATAVPVATVNNNIIAGSSAIFRSTAGNGWPMTMGKFARVEVPVEDRELLLVQTYAFAGVVVYGWVTLCFK